MSEKQLLQKALLSLQEKNRKIEALEKAAKDPVAVIGMACRFPGDVDSPAKYWELLKKGENPVRTVADDSNALIRGDEDRLHINQGSPVYLSLLEGIDLFDARFFRISAKEAKSLDPQHRILLEVCSEALEDAGSLNQHKEVETGVFVGISSSDYGHLLTHSLNTEDINSFFSTGNLSNVAAGRIAYTFGFNGPCMAIDTACSSSLVSVHLACQSLRNGECKQALAGGVNLILTTFGTQAAKQSELLSPTGKSRSFDAAADGYVRGEGCGMVVLKRLSDAVKDGDNIHALIMSSGVSQAGTRSGLTVPNGKEQQDLINSVISKSEVSLEDIGYVEAHGSGTILGDTIELGALAKVFKDSHYEGENPLYLGSVKSNFGNLESAAGIASLMKAILSLKNKEIPANLHFERPNPQIDWDKTSLQVVEQNTPWNTSAKQRFAGVSAFGFSGTNAHMIIGEAVEGYADIHLNAKPSLEHESEGHHRPIEILCLSAKKEDVLRQLALKYLAFIEKHPQTNLAHLCYTTNSCREHFEHRLSIKANDLIDLKEKLQDYVADEGKGFQAIKNLDPQVVFFFSGRTDCFNSALVNIVPIFKEKLLHCTQILSPWLKNTSFHNHQDGHVFDDTRNFPRTTAFVQHYALAETWQYWGIIPSVVMGQGIGEYLAACLAGILTLEDALQLVITWDRYAQGLENTSIEDYQRVADSITYSQPEIHIVSSVTGLMEGNKMTSSSYWRQPLEAPIVLEHSLEALVGEGDKVFFEVGPSDKTTLLANFHPQLLYLPSPKHGEDEWANTLENIAQLYEYGGTINWKKFYKGLNVRKISLPTYPFQRKSYWFKDNPNNHRPLKDQVNIELKSDTELPNNQSIIQQLTIIMSELLEESITEISANTPFIELGADSILIMQAIKRIKTQFGLEIPPKSLFVDLRDIETLANYIAQNAPNLAHQKLSTTDVKQENGLGFAKEYRAQSTLPQEDADFNRLVGYQLEMNAKLIDVLHKRNQKDNETAKATLDFKERQGKEMENLSLLVKDMADQAWQMRNLLQSESKRDDFIRIFEEKAQKKVNELGTPETLCSSHPGTIGENGKGASNFSGSTITVPLTVAQQQLWRLSQIDQGGWIAYNFSSNMVLDGHLHTPLIKEVIERLVDRHETLRTVIDDEGKYMQIRPSQPAIYHWVDFSQHQYVDAQKQLESWNLEESKKAFSLSEPFYRFTLLKLSEDRHMLSLSVNHILFDGWSMIVLLKEFAALYEALHKGVSFQMESPMQFRELIQLRANIDNAKRKKAEKYWMSKFSDTIPSLDLPLDSPRPLMKTYPGAKYQDHISNDLIEEVKALGKRHEATLFATLLAVYTLSLQKLSHQGYFVIGIPYSGRFLNHSETVAGYCSQLLPISCNFEDGITFTDHLRNTQNLLFEGFEHEDFPFSELIDRLKEKENVINNPLARATFNMNAVRSFPSVENLHASFAPTPLSYVAYDLTLTIIELEGGYKAEWNYNTDLFKEATILKFSAYFKQLLTQILQSPTQRIGQLSLLTPEMKASIQHRWNGHQMDLPKQKTVHQWFEEQVSSTPDRIALVCGGKQLNYQGLNERANQWCYFFQKQGLNDHTKAVVFLDKSDEMVAVLLGVMKTGAVFIAVDTTTPKSRLDLILKDVQPALVITDEFLSKDLGMTAEKTVKVDRVSGWVEEMPKDNPPLAIARQGVAYIVYTSGSTGTPKGILATHQGVINYLTYIQNTFHLSEKDVVLQLAPIGFDAAIRDIFGPLLAGAKVVFTKDSRDVQQVSKDLQEHNITCLLSTVPSLLGGLTEIVQQIDLQLDSLRLILVSGEVLTTKLAHKVMAVFDHALLVNQYGPTECTMTSTYYPVENIEENRNTIPLGQPIPNTEVYIMDKEGQFVPDGIIGEICIGGLGLAKGYFNQTELTHLKFQRHTISETEERLLYKTGDLGRFNVDGQLEFFGRKDHQLKIRGFRIELDEVEIAILKHPKVTACAVIPSQDKQGQLAMYAYLSSQEELSLTALMQHLREHLPEYAIPAKFISLESLPLTVNGKIDRKALSHLGTEMESDGEYVAPVNEVEESLSKIWHELFDKSPISTQDKFFDIGGNSLKAIQLIGRINKAHKKLLTVADIFANPTIQELGLLLTGSGQEEYQQIPPLPVQESYALSHAQKRLWIIDQFEENQIAYNISGMLPYNAQIDKDAFQQAFEGLVKRHESLRTIFIVQGDEPRQKVLPWEEMDFNIQYFDLSPLEGEERQLRIAEEQKEAPFQLDKGPLLRVKLLKLEESKHLIICSTHHITADGWSMNVMINEVLARYQALEKGLQDPFRPLEVHFKDYAAWQNQLIQGKHQKKYKSFWQQYFEGPLPSLELPLDKKRPEHPSFNGGVVEFDLDQSLMKRIKHQVKSGGETLFSSLLAMVKLLLYRCSGQDDIIVGIPVACRDRRELEDQIGFYINTTAIRSRFVQGETVAQYLKRTAKNMLEIHEHAIYPFDLLVEDLEKNGSLRNRNGLFNVMVQIQDTHQSIVESAQAAELRETIVGTNNDISKFDLTFNFTLLDDKQAILVSIEYNTDLFYESSIEKMKGDFLYLVEKAMNDTTITIDSQDILPLDEKKDLLNDFLKPLDEF